jgi:hypothetical protein
MSEQNLPPQSGQDGQPPVNPPIQPSVPPIQPSSQQPEQKIEFTKEAFEGRLSQAQRSAVKKLLQEKGFDSEESFNSFLEESKKRELEIEERKRAELTELERSKKDIEDRDKMIELKEQKIAELEAEKSAALMNIRLNDLFAERGIKNTRYARYLLKEELKNADENFDEGKYLDGICSDPSEMAALGISSDQPSQRKPASTTGPDTKPPPRPEPYKGPQKRVEDMTKEEWQDHKRKLLGG